MKPETQDWTDKAEGDWKVAQRESQATDPVWNVITFLSQQCAEKYLKGFLEENNIRFRKTQDLALLLDTCGGSIPELTSWRPRLAHLSTFGISARYPGVEAIQQDGEESLEIAD
ncbi:MAG: HEPN domain-containing protein [Planctomycetota bacterium]|jgi:HEPN domain-containing protein|nr:HEPN domain-containing protein [Planctomycetota bacterium]